MEETTKLHIQVDGEEIELDEQGYLSNLNDWSEALAIYMAERDGVRFTKDHLRVIRLIRSYYLTYRIAPMPKLIVKKLNEGRKRCNYNVRYLYKLFPRTPLHKACRYAGVPRPSGCT